MHGIELSLEKFHASKSPLIGRRIFHGASGRGLLTVGTEGAEERSSSVMGGAAPKAGFVEEVVESDREYLTQACGQHLKESRAAGSPGKAHEAVAELVSGPLGSVTRVKAADDAIMTK
jgi:hypothetical protein